MRALIIDDARVMRRIVATTLRDLGFETAEAGDGRQALDLLEAGERFDLACVDWNMPVMDGLQFVQAVRAGRQPQPDAGVGIRTVEIVKAAQESASRAGTPIPL